MMMQEQIISSVPAFIGRQTRPDRSQSLLTMGTRYLPVPLVRALG